MGQYWHVVNLDKWEGLHPHRLGSGLKLGEMVGTHPGPAAALIILCAAMPERRGGGDLIDAAVVGRWAGDRIAIVGDYAEPHDIPGRDDADLLYTLFNAKREDLDDNPRALAAFDQRGPIKDISNVVAAAIEEELGGKFHGTGWRHFHEHGTGIDCYCQKERTEA